ncbi:uncharacterized protein AB675_4543 [Cyphellophora attinorum]|uniref:Uncharacterized protein n=1 Tax=Cyphellophora attinorum TaxID=1664694 RepID=A0A0N1H2S5_9EURO|nr:uncharacterized protein AB675_4543 [Phialophora attinorum]KPI39064.1 hypothetical protein AB675_4543 [Phialophora attinorum]
MSSTKPTARGMTSETAGKAQKRKVMDVESSDESAHTVHFDEQPIREAAKPATTPATAKVPALKSATPASAAVKSKITTTPAATPPAASRKVKSDSTEVEVIDTPLSPPVKRQRQTKKTIAEANVPSAASMKKKEKPAPPCPVSVGDMGFHKSLNVVNNKPMSDKKILVRVMEVEWDSGSGKWCVLLENRGDILPREAAWWEDANKVELPLGKGTEVMVKVNTGWVEGVVEGVERDDDKGEWLYECDVVGTIKAASDKVKEAKSPHKVKVEKSIKKRYRKHHAPSSSDTSGSGNPSIPKKRPHSATVQDGSTSNEPPNSKAVKKQDVHQINSNAQIPGPKYSKGERVFLKFPREWGERRTCGFHIGRNRWDAIEQSWLYDFVWCGEEGISFSVVEDRVLRPKFKAGDRIKRELGSGVEVDIVVTQVTFDGEQIKYRVLMTGSLLASEIQSAHGDVSREQGYPEVVIDGDNVTVKSICVTSSSISMGGMIRSAIGGMGGVLNGVPKFAVDKDKVNFKASLILKDL